MATYTTCVPGSNRYFEVMKDSSKVYIKSQKAAMQSVSSVIDEVSHVIRSNGDPWDRRALMRLERWQSRCEQGSRLDLRTPFRSEFSHAQNVKWLADIESDASPIAQLHPEALRVYRELENDQAKVQGPKSAFNPYSVDGPTKVHAVFSNKPLTSRVNWGAYNQALDWVRFLLPSGRISRWAIAEAVKGLHGDATLALNDTTNSGHPFWIGSWSQIVSKPTEERVGAFRWYVNYANEYFRRLDHSKNVKADAPYAVATFNQRTVMKGPDPLKPDENGQYKGKRFVCALSKETVLPGKCYEGAVQPLLAKCRNPKSGILLMPGWQPGYVQDKSMQLLLQRAHDNNRTVLSGDISSFDATVPPQVIWDVAQAMSEWIKPEERCSFLGIFYAETYKCYCITPTELVTPVPSSVKSGSIWTSVIGCMVNLFIQQYGQFCGYYSIDTQCAMGDDFVVDGDGVTPDSVSHAFADFGMVCHPDKQFVERDMLHFLQRLHVLGCPGGIGSVERVGLNAMVMEGVGSLLDSKDLSKSLGWKYVARALFQLENLNFNPYFEEVVQAFADIDQLHLGRDIDARLVSKYAGNYLDTRLLREVIIKPWTSGRGLGFSDFTVNRVLRGEKLPPPGKERFQAVYGRSFDSVTA